MAAGVRGVITSLGRSVPPPPPVSPSVRSMLAQWLGGASKIPTALAEEQRLIWRGDYGSFFQRSSGD